MVDEIPEYSINDQLRGLVEQLSAYIETYHGGEVEFIDFDGKIVTRKSNRLYKLGLIHQLANRFLIQQSNGCRARSRQ